MTNEQILTKAKMEIEKNRKIIRKVMNKKIKKAQIEFEKKEKIIEGVMDKARKNGWKEPAYDYGQHLDLLENPNLFIFSHNFAKAFAKYILETKQVEKLAWYINTTSAHQFEPDIEWKDIKKIYDEERIEDIKNNLLVNMVMEKEPLKYLERFL